MGVTFQMDEFLLLYITGCFYRRTDGTFKLKKVIQLVVNKGGRPPACFYLLTIFSHKETPRSLIFCSTIGVHFSAFSIILLGIRKRRLVLLL